MTVKGSLIKRESNEIKIKLNKFTYILYFYSADFIIFFKLEKIFGKVTENFNFWINETKMIDKYLL